MDGRRMRQNILNSFSHPLLKSVSMARRVTHSEVNMLSTMPTESVTANPRTGPVPTRYKITAVSNVVTLASTIVVWALS